MKIKIYLTLAISFSFFFFQTLAFDGLIIKKNDLVLLNLNNIKLKRLIKNNNLKIELIGNNNLKLLKENNKIKLHIIPYKSSEIGKIKINYKGKKRIIDYKLDYQIDYFNILGKLNQKSLQNKPLSCEVSAASDIITYLNKIKVPEDTILQKLDKSMYNQKAKKIGNKKIWGNPEKGFVGYIDYYGSSKTKPKQRLYTGYGVYEKPIAKIYNEYGLDSKIINKSNYNKSFGKKEHLKLLLVSLIKGDMVQLWGDWCTDPSFEDGVIDKAEINAKKVALGYSGKNYCSTFKKERKLEWYYKDGELYKKHIGLIGEHAFYLLGFEGKIDNPKKIIVWDTDTGYHKYDIQEWMRKWERMDYRSIIVSKKKKQDNKLLVDYYKSKRSKD